MSVLYRAIGVLTLSVSATALVGCGYLNKGKESASETEAESQGSYGKQPNIVFIMGDDIGWFNIGAYHRGIMAGKTPNLDKLADDGMLFTDYYAEASCTAGRANFLTGQLPVRTGMTTVGQAGSKLGIPKEAPTIGNALKSMGYATGQFGKNHLGDHNEFLPCVHGFDEFYGYLYHLDAMEDPAWHSYPKDPDFVGKYGPRNVVGCKATAAEDETEDPRWGKVGKQVVEDGGTLYPERMKTFDNEIVDRAFKFIDKAKSDGKPFFLYVNPTRMHVITHLSDEYAGQMTPENGYYQYEAGMVQLDDIVGSIRKKLADDGLTDETIIVFTTDNGAEVFTWPDGGMTPFKGTKGMTTEGGFRVPAIISWPGVVDPGSVSNDLFSGLDWFPTLVAAAGNPNIAEELKAGKTLDGQEFKVHLDGYNQTEVLAGSGPSKRTEIYYFAESTVGAVRIDDYKYVFIDQPGGWFGPKEKLNMPRLYNIRLDPFERAYMDEAPPQLADFYVHEFWRFVFVQEKVREMAQTFVDFPPMQRGASFNLDDLKLQIEEAMAKHPAQ